jgi:2-polyprenyl-3-methyl-5-hydroxy-6-metoxy-1,4-benzoquinol methylase
MDLNDRPSDHPGPIAADRWARDLAAWRIPDEILATAPQSPWIHPVELFRAPDQPVPDSPSHARARERLDAGGSVLDVGSGGGRATFAIAPPAALVTAVDHQQGMLDTFAEAARERGLQHSEILGDWPDVADRTPTADVVVCHHVVYNVADLAPFVTALDAHARRRVVLELPRRHPLAPMAPLWRHFWNLERPDGPTASDALRVIREAGLDAHLQEWDDDPATRALPALPMAQQVEFMRIRLCLTPDRDAELADVMDVMTATPPAPRQPATIWWDVTA